MSESDTEFICDDCGEEITEDDRAVSQRQSGPGEIKRYHLGCYGNAE